MAPTWAGPGLFDALEFCTCFSSFQPILTMIQIRSSGTLSEVVGNVFHAALMHAQLISL